MHQSTKTYGHDVGLSACFRQWRAKSHCSLLHGYALSIGFVFEAQELDGNNWVVDFGGLKGLKELLQDRFDHKTIVAHDDPLMEWFINGEQQGLLSLVIVPATGCEKFAELVYQLTVRWMAQEWRGDRVRLVSVEVREHGANSAIYKP